MQKTFYLYRLLLAINIYKYNQSADYNLWYVKDTYGILI